VVNTTLLTLDVMRILDDHSAKIKPPTTAKTAVKPKLTEIEMASLPLLGLLVLLAEAPEEPLPVADAVEPPELPDGELEELELEFKALFR